jgi:hypothetical protein
MIARFVTETKRRINVVHKWLIFGRLPATQGLLQAQERQSPEKSNLLLVHCASGKKSDHFFFFISFQVESQDF